MDTTSTWWPGVDRAALAEHFDPQSLTRGASYARGKRVLSLTHDERTGSLSAHVVGNGRIYETTVGLDARGYETRCTCPIAYDCKHAAAVLLAAGAGQLERGPRGTPRRAPPARRAMTDGEGTAAPSAWESRLLELIADQQPSANVTPLAIELKLSVPAHAAQSGPRLGARLMRPGAHGGWVNGQLAWNHLDDWAVREHAFRDDHLTLLRELYETQRIGRSPGSMYSWSRSSERSLDISGFTSPRLWPLLSEAQRIGISFVHATRGLGTIPPIDTGELVFDIVGGADGGALAGAELRHDRPADDPESIAPLALIGQPAHGVVYTPQDDLELALERRRIRLVQLRRPVSPVLARMLRGERLEVPAAELERFRAIVPGLGRVAPILSHDDSFRPPDVRGPELGLAVVHGPGAQVRLDWEWRYAVDDTETTARLGPAGGHRGVRDPAAERDRLLAVTLTEPLLARAGLLDSDGHPAPAAPADFTGAEAIAVSTDLLPRLARADISLRVLGEAPDYRDVGESLRIEVSTGEISGERDWFDLGISISLEGREAEFVEVFRALVRGDRRMILEDGAHFSLDDPRLQTLRELIEEARSLSDGPPDQLRISRFQAGLWDELTDVAVVAGEAQRWREQVAPLADLDRLAPTEPPAALQATLRPYQRDGLAWLAALWELGLGGILADDMGLGKTVQALALILHARQRDPGTGPFLVVTPTSVATNWAAEAARFAPSLGVEVVLDTLTRSGRRIEDIATGDVVITTYTLQRLDHDAYSGVEWAGVILDEAQFVKNPRSKTHRCLRDLGSPFTLAITGTPMENNLSELWALLALTAPGLFPDPQRFADEYAKPIERDHDAERLGRLRRRIRPLMMRRTKELVAAELPPKHEQTLTVELHPRHRKLYDTHLQRERQRVLALLDDYDSHRIAIFRSLTRLRQLSLHPGLIDPAHAGIPCAKLETLLEHLCELADVGHRALVFSQFTSFLALVRERLDEAGIAHGYLDGSTRRREEVIERFRSGADPVFLISLKAGGVGLNLTEADYCFLLDPWWNPAVEAQAIGRAHRIGQTAQVIAYRLISRATIEEKVRALAETKAALFSGVMDDGELFSSAVTAQDIRELVA